MNVLLNPYGAVGDMTPAMSADVSIIEAGRRSLQRCLQALFRENLLLKDHLIVEGSITWLPLWSQQAVLRFEGLQIGRIGNCQIFGPTSYYKIGERPQPIPTASSLLACVAYSLPGAAPDDLQRLKHELENSVENDALCLNYRRNWAQQLVAKIGSDQPCFIAAVRNSTLPNPALLLEQWGTLCVHERHHHRIDGAHFCGHAIPGQYSSIDAATRLKLVAQA